MTRTGPINSTITLRAKFYQNGVLFSPYSVNDVKIYPASTGTSGLIASLTPTEESTGIFSVTFLASDYGLTNAPVTLYDSWTWVAESDMASNTQRFSFDLTVAEEDADDETETSAVSVVCRTRPSWTNLIGITKIDDLGNGSGIFIGWTTARPADYTNSIRYNIYYSDTRMGVFDNPPKAITAEEYCTIYIDDPGTVHYFAVRATETDSNFDISQMPQLGVNLYAYPDATELTEDLAFESDDGYNIPVLDTTGFPDEGELQIGTEVLYYSSVDRVNNIFIVPSDGRGYESTNINQHREGASVYLWRGVEDRNSVIRQGIATWHNQVPQNVDAIGEVNVDGDGYKSVNEDIITTDLEYADDNYSDFSAYDFCGYHRATPEETFNGSCVGSYVGGEFNGSRGFNLAERTFARLEVQLQTTGIPAVLLRRKWAGKRCKCFGLRREHARSRCDSCYGTNFEGGYTRYVNTRPISESFINTEGFIMVRVEPYNNDLQIQQNQGLVQPDELSCWTLSIPTVKDRDIIILYNADFVEEFRYEILSVTRNYLFLQNVGKQSFTMRKLDRTDMVYTYDTSITT